MPRLRSKGMPVGALLLLCLLWASASLRSDLLTGSASPGASSPLLGQAVRLGMLACVSVIVALARRTKWPRGRALVKSALAGIGLFVAPAILISLAKGLIDESTRVALFSLVPVFTVVLEPHLGAGSPTQQRGGLVAGLVAVAGTLLVFPLELPQSIATAFAFAGIVLAAATVAAANCLAVQLVFESPTQSAFSFASIAAGSAALVFSALSPITESHSQPTSLFSPWIVFDLFALALLFWLMRRMTAVRMTTRFLIAPLLANFIGLAFLRPEVQFRGWLGLFLIALGSGWLLLAHDDEPQSTGSPLSIRQR